MSESNTTPSHRHDNRTELEKLLHKSKPWLEENGTLLIYGLAAVLAVAAVIVYLNRQPQGEVQASHDLLAAATPKNFGNQKPGDFRDVADAFPDTVIGTWARLRQADLLLDNAISNMFSDRPTSSDELDQAQAAYDRLAKRSDISEEIRERVLIGLARLTEARCDGKPDSTNAAVAAWQRVLKEFPASIVKKQAEERIAVLETEDSRSFYAWFSAQNPVPADPGLEPGQPSVPSVPSHPSFEIPALPPGADSTETSDSEPKTGTDATGTDATDDAAKGVGDQVKPESDEQPAATPTKDPQSKSDTGSETKPAAAGEENPVKEAAPESNPAPPEDKTAPEQEPDATQTPGSDDDKSDAAASEPKATQADDAGSPGETQK